MIHKVIMNTMIMMNFQVPKLILLFMMNKQMMIKIYFIKLLQKIRVRMQKDSQKKRKSAF